MCREHGRICAKKALLKMSFDHWAQVDLLKMSPYETDDGFKWIVQYRDHHSGKGDVGATEDRNAAEVVPVIIRIIS